MSEGNAGGILLSVVIPCFNEESGIAEVYRSVTGVCRACVGAAYEIVLVNDGSRDRTWPEIRTLAESDEHVVAVSLSRNFGHQIALSAGLKVCCGERVLVLDADLQDPPELLPQMMAQMDKPCDVVYGRRLTRAGETLFKRATAYLFYRILNQLVDVPVPPDTGDFRLMSRRVVDAINEMPEHHRFMRGMVSWVGFSQEEIAYERAPRLSGASKYPLAKMLRFAGDAITGFSVRPLRIAAYLGIGFGALALILMGYVLISYLTAQTVRGWASLAAIVLLLGSAQLFVIGLIGEYLGRLYIESKGRPLFVISDLICLRNGARPDLDALRSLSDARRVSQRTDPSPISRTAG
jgi:dolichol-phosphate mannosyltransferase